MCNGKYVYTIIMNSIHAMMGMNSSYFLSWLGHVYTFSYSDWFRVTFNSAYSVLLSLYDVTIICVYTVCSYDVHRRTIFHKILDILG